MSNQGPTVCDRCGSPLVRADSAMPITGEPVSDRGPRLVETVCCRECSISLQRWLAEPVARALAIVDDESS
jgi:hypothetical protein